MAELPFSAAEASAASPHAHAAQGSACDECLGSGGWYRYEPALEPTPGMLYLSCVHCRGSGRATVLRPE